MQIKLFSDNANVIYILETALCTTGQSNFRSIENPNKKGSRFTILWFILNIDHFDHLLENNTPGDISVYKLTTQIYPVLHWFIILHILIVYG